MMESIFTTRVIPHDEAREIARRLINSHFRQEPGARVGIPARPDYDDDLLIVAYINQQNATADEIARLNRRVADLLAANNRYLERARRAEEDGRFQRMQIIHLVGAIGADALIAVVDDNTKLRARLAEVSGSRPRRRWRPYV